MTAEDFVLQRYSIYFGFDKNDKEFTSLEEGNFNYTDTHGENANYNELCDYFCVKTKDLPIQEINEIIN